MSFVKRVLKMDRQTLKPKKCENALTKHPVIVWLVAYYSPYLIIFIDSRVRQFASPNEIVSPLIVLKESSKTKQSLKS